MKQVRNVVCFLIMVLPTIATAQVISKCGESSGYEYFFAGGLVSKKDAGWQKGAITGGSFILLKSGDSFDIVFTDATGRTSSTVEDGGKILATIEKESIALIVIYPGVSIETWIFRLDESGSGEVTYSQARYNGVLTSKHGLMRAACGKYSTPLKK